MQNTQRAKQNTPEEQDRRKEKERRREEKELRKIAAAAGVRMAKPTTSTQVLAPVPTPGESKLAGFKKGGWASIPSGTAELLSVAQAPPTRTDWGAVGSSANPFPTPSPAPDTVFPSSRFPTAPETSRPRDQSSQDQVQDVQRPLHMPAPAFRTGGWSSIDSTTQIPSSFPSGDVPASSTVAADLHRLPEQQQQLPGPALTPATLSAHPLPETVPQPSSVLPSSRASVSNLESLIPKPSRSKKEREAEMRENARSGWQNFQRGGRRK
jgi:hypothetical protein